MIFVQRQGTVGSVGFTGDAARVLDSTGKVIVDWTSGGTLNNIPQGDGYKLEVRTGSTTTSTDLAVGAVVFTMGQSNIERWFNTPTGIPDGPAKTYMMETDGSIGPVEGGASTYFADAYAGLAGVPVLIVAAAKGGTALTQGADKGNGYWLDTSSGSLYSRALDLLARVGGSAEVVLWAQGETDASAGVTTSAYASALTTFMQRVLADFDVDKVFIQEIGPRGSNDGKYDAVRAAQHQVANALAGVDIGAITTDLLTIEDGIHLSGAARLMAADRMLVSAAATLGVNITRALQTGTDSATAGDTLNGTAGRDELRGLAGNDILDGGAESDVILGGAGNDTIRGGEGFDLLNGDGGDDLIQGGNGTDGISGGDGNDTIEGGAGADEIWADAGDDRVTGGLGNDALFGGAGYDTAVFLGRFADYSVIVSGGTITVRDINLADGDEGTDILQGFEQLAFSDRTYDPAGPGLPGLFTTGTDFVDFALVTSGTYAPTSLYNALGGNDEVYLPRDAAAATAAGYDSATAFDAGAGDDVVIGGSLNDIIRGGDGNDILNGGTGSDRLEGGLGNDTYYVDVTSVDSTGDVIIERLNEGTDTVLSTVTHTLKSHVENLTLLGALDINGTGNDLANVIEGNDGRNSINGNAGNDTISGRGGDDSIRGGLGNDTIDGGQGRDTAVFAGAMAGYRISVTNGIATVTDINTADGDEGTDIISNAEILKFSDTSFLLPDPLSLFTAGSDTLEFANVIAGNYTAGTQYAALAGDDHVTLAQTAEAAARAGYDPLVAFDAGAGNDTVIGGGLADIVRGGDGNDTLVGGTGADRLEGGNGNDRLEGGQDGVSDYLRGGAGDDTYVLHETESVGESSGAGHDTVLTSVLTYKLGSNFEDLVFIGTGSFRGTGNGLDNRIQGGSGADTLDGGAGNDVLIGGAGNDTYRVNSLGDRVIESVDPGSTSIADAGGIDTILISSGLTAYDLSTVAFVENLTYSGSLAFTLTGNGLDNALRGGGGTDTLIGGAGRDTLTGGSGADTFFFRSLREGADVVMDFSRTQGDKFGLLGSEFGLAAGALAADRFVVGTSATSAQGQFLYDTAKRTLSWDADGTGAGAAVELFSQAKTITLAASDFFVV